MLPVTCRRLASLLALTALVSCACPDAEFILIATVVDDPTGQIISTPSFTGAAKYAQCQTFIDTGGEGGGTTMGPCRDWRVHANPGGGKIVVSAEDFVSESFDVPAKLADECEIEQREKTFRLDRK